jgi:hypothetical protein
VPPRVGVTPQEEVEFVLLDADGHVQVAAFEGGIELDPSGFGLDLVSLPVLADPLDGLPHHSQRRVVARTVPPGVFVLLVELHRIGGSWSEEDQFEPVIAGQVCEECIGVGVGVGEGEGAGGQFGPPPEDHVWLQGVVVRVQHFSCGFFEVVAQVVGGVVEGTVVFGIVVLPSVLVRK